MTGQIKAWYRKRDKRWMTSINLPKHPDGRRHRKCFYAKTAEQAVALATGARSPDRVVAISNMIEVLDTNPSLDPKSRVLLIQAISELETKL